MGGVKGLDFKVLRDSDGTSSEIQILRRPLRNNSDANHIGHKRTQLAVPYLLNLPGEKVI